MYHSIYFTLGNVYAIIHKLEEHAASQREL
jgi:hypothetical protein